MNSSASLPVSSTSYLGNGLSFNGQGGYAESTCRGIAGNGLRTVADWVRLPELNHEGNRNCILSWGVPLPKKKSEIIWNRSESHGTVGFIRLDFGKGRMVGNTDLRDSLWYHFAIVFHGGESADFTTHVKIYVDGRLETITGKLQQQILTDTSAPRAVPVTLGRFIDGRAKVPSGYFIGELDEVYILDAALSPGQIVKLKENNRSVPWNKIEAVSPK